MVKTKFRKDIPSCKKGKNHKWKKGNQIFKETGICGKCGYDQFDNTYRKVPSSNNDFKKVSQVTNRCSRCDAYEEGMIKGEICSSCKLGKPIPKS